MGKPPCRLDHKAMKKGGSNSHQRLRTAPSNAAYSSMNSNSEKVCGRMISNCHRPRKASAPSPAATSIDPDFRHVSQTSKPITAERTNELVTCTKFRPPAQNKR